MNKAHYSKELSNRNWPGRTKLFRSFRGELDQEIVDEFDRAHTMKATDDL